MKLVRISISVFVSLFLLIGCETVAYYGQSISGHTALMWSRKSIDKMLEAADTSLGQRLLTARAVRQFAVTDLHLPDNDSYTHYVALDRDAVVWNVVAAENFSLDAKQWCYLIIGCASYRGYFKHSSASGYAQALANEGYDVAVLGATAYSTLGWFADPLTSLMLRRDDAAIAELIFHELAHQQLYIKGDSRFNEAFATAVGEWGALLWLEKTQQSDLLEKYRLRLQVRDDFINLVDVTKAELKQLYKNELTDDEKSREKNRIFLRMRDNYESLKIEKWQGRGWYDRWFETPVNNARLVAIGTHRDLVPDFVNLLQRCDRDFLRFYAIVKKISETKERDLKVSCE